MRVLTCFAWSQYGALITKAANTRKWHHCAIYFVNSLRFGREYKQSKCNIFWYAIYRLSIRDALNYTFLESLWQDEQFDTTFREIGACFKCWILKVNGGHLGNATICGISEKFCLSFLLNSVQSFRLATICGISEKCYLCFY